VIARLLRVSAYACIAYFVWALTLYLTWQMELSTSILHNSKWFWIVSTAIILECRHWARESRS
jgi:hypothetical protein